MIEARLDTLEKQQPLSRQPSPQQQQSPYKCVSSKPQKIPDFHHGAGHKILQYWSRLRIHLNVPNMDVLRLLEDAEKQDVKIKKPFQRLEELYIPLSLANESLRLWSSTVNHLPISFFMLMTSGVLFSVEQFLALREMISSTIHSGLEDLRLSDFSATEMLILLVALRSLPESRGSNQSDICFNWLLQQLWRVQIEPDQMVIPFILAVAHVFLYTYAMPFHALGMLQIVDSAITRMCVQNEQL